MPVQTRFRTNLNGNINAVADSALLNAAPAFSTGLGTFERGTANEEDIYWGDLSGLMIQDMMRGLSSTALTLTEIEGNKLPHDDDAVFEATLLHYIVNNKADLDEDEVYTGDNESTGTFIFANDGAQSKTDAAPTEDKAFTNKKYVDDEVAEKVALTGNESIAGIKTFADDSARSTTNAAPIDEKSFANKKYVDDQIGTTANNKVAVSATELAPGFIEEQFVDDSNGYLTWEKDGADGADQTFRPVIDADAIINTGRPTFPLEAAEAIDGSVTPQVVAMLCDNMYGQKIQSTTALFNIAGTTYNVGSIDASTRRSFILNITNSFVATIQLESIQLLLHKTGTPADNIYIEIYTSAGGNPDVLVANGTSANIAGGTVTNDEIKKFTFATKPVLTVSTDYVVVLRRSGANDAANYYGVEGIGSGVNAHKVLTASSGVWTSTGESIGYIATYIFNAAGKAILGSSNPAIKSRARIIGLTTSDVVVGEDIEVQAYGTNSSFAGLSPGDDYYADPSSNGGIENDITLNLNRVYPFGKALSATTLLIKPEQKIYKDSLLPGGTNIDVVGSWEYFIETGFEVKEFYLSVAVSTAVVDANISFSFNSQDLLEVQDLTAGYAVDDGVTIIGLEGATVPKPTIEKKKNGILLSSSTQFNEIIIIAKG